jgi:hypothetical protein
MRACGRRVARANKSIQTFSSLRVFHGPYELKMNESPNESKIGKVCSWAWKPKWIKKGNLSTEIVKKKSRPLRREDNSFRTRQMARCGARKRRRVESSVRCIQLVTKGTYICSRGGRRCTRRDPRRGVRGEGSGSCLKTRSSSYSS